MTRAVRRTIVASLTVGIALATSAVVLMPHVGRPAAPAGQGTRAPSASPSDSVPASPPPPGTVISADVVVYGATPSGILAAVSAAREGASVVLLTPEGQVGGMMTSGLGHPDIGRATLIGGLTRDVFEAIARAEGDATPAQAAGWNAEPHVAAAVFEKLLRDAHVVTYLGMHLDRGRPPDIQGGRILAIRMTDGTRVNGSVFVDATYEGDLMAAAGVPWVIGRESRDTYGEPLAGVHVDTGKPSRLVSGVDAAGDPLPGVEVATIVPGSADDLVQPATYRLCVTRDPANRLPFTRPTGYDPTAYALIGRAIATARARTGVAPTLASVLSLARLPGGKADLNNFGLYSTDLVGGANGWAAADDAGRRLIRQAHRDWVAGLLWYLQTDPDVPPAIRGEMARWGLCADEFRATGGWPPELYIREARRMVGNVVLTQRDLQQDVAKAAPIALGTYRIDAHYVRRVLDRDGLVRGDGQLSGPTRPYQIPYAAIVPPLGSVDNLLVSVTISVSHVAWTSIRTEPTLMEIGEAAGAAAAVAVRDRVGVREVPYEAIRAILLARGGILAAPAGEPSPSPGPQGSGGSSRPSPTAGGSAVR